jgi:hypothetical protein
MALLRLTDFRMAGFLVARGASFKGTDTNGKNEVVFRFEDSDGTATEILNQYPGSPEHTYDSACKTMHDFVKMAIRRRPGGRRG